MEEGYYYLRGNMKMGPYSLDSLRHAPITSETMVNKVGTQEWVAAGTVPELQFLFVKKSPSNSLEEVQKKIQHLPPPIFMLTKYIRYITLKFPAI